MMALVLIFLNKIFVLILLAVIIVIIIHLIFIATDTQLKHSNKQASSQEEFYLQIFFASNSLPFINQNKYLKSPLKLPSILSSQKKKNALNM